MSTLRTNGYLHINGGVRRFWLRTIGDLNIWTSLALAQAIYIYIQEWGSLTEQSYQLTAREERQNKNDCCVLNLQHLFSSGFNPPNIRYTLSWIWLAGGNVVEHNWLRQLQRIEIQIYSPYYIRWHNCRALPYLLCMVVTLMTILLWTDSLNKKTNWA